jgi:nicotinate-nucleotide adenylyltransferase
MKIVLFGGTFDPVHAEHVKLARGAIKELSPDKLIVLPSYVPPHKAGASASAEHRLKMAQIAFSFDPRIEVSDYEISKGGSSYSYITVEHFRSLYPDDELIFLIGGDSFFDFEGWVHPEIIAAKSRIAVVSRGEFTEKLMTRNAEFERLHGYKAKILSFTGDHVSSTYIRYMLMLGLTASLPDGVCEYVKQHGLYRGDRLFDYISAHLKERRLIHTAGVIECALLLNRQLGLDRQKVITACALHDVAKYMRPSDFPSFTMPDNMPPSVVHAFLGEYVSREVLGITDEDVLSAIRYHTTGRADMTELEKLVYVADLLEKNRDYPGVDKLRKLTFDNFEVGFCECMRQGYKHIKQQMMPGGVYYLTIEAYEFYKNQNPVNRT